MKTKSYKVITNGISMGSFPGASAREAIENYTQDAGYASLEAACAALSLTEEEFLSEIEVEEEE